jgi:predicted transcriptional regulator
MLTRQEREQAVLGLYNQGKTIREIAKEVRMSFRDIGAVLKKEEKEKERQNNATITADCDSTQPDVSLPAQAYELFSQGKTPVEVAIELDLSESRVTKYYKEYWKLKGLYKLNIIHDEIKDDVTYFVKLYRVSKAAGMSVEHVVNLLSIANNDLSALENRYKRLQENVDHLESKELDLSINLEELKSQIQDASQRLGFYRLSCQKEVSKMLQLIRQNMRLSALLRWFKNNNKEYIQIRFVAKQTVKNALSDKGLLLKLALNALIESWRADPTKFNFLVHGMSPVSTISRSTMMNYGGSSYHANHFLYYHNQNGYAETLKEVLVNEAASLYEKMVKDFTNQTINQAAACQFKSGTSDDTFR